MEDRSKDVKIGLGFTLLKLKIHRDTVRHITVEEVDDKESVREQAPRPSVFSRLSQSSPQNLATNEEDSATRPSVFRRLGASVSRTSAFDRLSSRETRESVFESLGGNNAPTSSTELNATRHEKKRPKRHVEKEDRKNIRLEDTKDVRSAVPS